MMLKDAPLPWQAHFDRLELSLPQSSRGFLAASGQIRAFAQLSAGFPPGPGTHRSAVVIFAGDGLLAVFVPPDPDALLSPIRVRPFPLLLPVGIPGSKSTDGLVVAEFSLPRGLAVGVPGGKRAVPFVLAAALKGSQGAGIPVVGCFDHKQGMEIRHLLLFVALVGIVIGDLRSQSPPAVIFLLGSQCPSGSEMQDIT